MAAVVLWMWQIRAHKASIPCLLPCLSPESLSSLRSFQPSSSAYKSLDTASPFQSQFPLSGRFFFPFFFFFLFNFTILYWFCHISKWIRRRYTCVPHPEPSSLLPPHTLPLGRPSAPAPSIQYRASNLDWWLVSYMMLYIFQCHSPKSSHPLPLPQSPKDCSIHHSILYLTKSFRSPVTSSEMSVLTILSPPWILH